MEKLLDLFTVYWLIKEKFIRPVIQGILGEVDLTAVLPLKRWRKQWINA
jgi:hypothetical protein